MKITHGTWIGFQRSHTLYMRCFVVPHNLSSIQNLIVKVQRLSERSCEFDIVGVDASVANALRRILIAEVSF